MNSPTTPNQPDRQVVDTVAAPNEAELAAMPEGQGTEGSSMGSSLPWFEEGLERVPQPRPQQRRGQYIWIYHVPRLYLEDVEAIVYLIGKQCREVSMRTEEFKLRQPKQLRKLPQERIMRFVVVGSSPDIEVDIRSGSSTIITPSDDPEVKFLVSDMLSIFDRRKVRISELLSKGKFLLGCFLSLIVVSIIAYWFSPMRFKQLMVLIAPIGMLLILYIPSIVGGSRKGVIVPMYKSELPKAWYVSDTLKIALVVAVVTAILSVIGTLLFVDSRP